MNDLAIPEFLVKLVGELQIKLAAAEAQLQALSEAKQKPKRQKKDG